MPRYLISFDAQAMDRVPEADLPARPRAVTEGSYPGAVGGMWLADVLTREEALRSAAKTAVACRCAQEVREFMPDPAVGST